MSFKKKTKVTAEFSMASLTDIIFLLLIFFMLTSGLVSPNALNLQLPGSREDSRSAVKKADRVNVKEDGSLEWNGKPSSLADLDAALRQKANTDGVLTIAPDSGTPTEHVVAVMDLALRYDLTSVLAINRD